MKPMGFFENSELVCLAMPILDEIRDFRKYDIGAIFISKTLNTDKAIDLMWEYAIDTCLKDTAVIGNANAEYDNSPLGVSLCEGLVKVSKNCLYYK